MEIFIPDNAPQERALARTTHLTVAAHQDDVEFMAFSPIAECFGREDLWFSAVIVTDGAGSPRSGIYADYTDERMKEVRIEEQKKAAHLGEYGFLALLGHPSREIKAGEGAAEEELVRLLRAARPRIVYTHNLADKHPTHVAAALRLIAALRTLAPGERPEKVYGCEVWRDLDWMCDEEKVLLDCSAHPNLARSLSGVFDSQIAGGKRYDLAAEGRRLAHATFSESHACDAYSALNYAMDLTPLMDENADVVSFISGYIDRFRAAVAEQIRQLMH